MSSTQRRPPPAPPPGRMHVNTPAVLVMPIVPVDARTKVIARWWRGTELTHPHLRVRVFGPDGMTACWTVTYP